MCFECGDEENTLNSKIIMNNRWLLYWPEIQIAIISEMVIASIIICLVNMVINAATRMIMLL